MSRLPKIAALGSILLAPVCAQAYQPLITDDTGTQGAGGNQLELAWGHNQADVADHSLRTDSLGLTLTHGLTDKIDLAVEMPWVRSDFAEQTRSGAGNFDPADDMPWVWHGFADQTHSGAGNVDIFGKWRFFEQDQGWSLALKPEITFPVSADKQSDGLGDHATTYELSLLMSRPMAFGKVDFNLGAGHYDNRDHRGEDGNVYHASVAPAWQVTPSTRLALDLGIDHDSVADDNSKYALLGVVYSPNKHLDLAAGVQKTFSARDLDNDWSTTVGLTWHIE